MKETRSELFLIPAPRRFSAADMNRFAEARLAATVGTPCKDPFMAAHLVCSPKRDGDATTRAVREVQAGAEDTDAGCDPGRDTPRARPHRRRPYAERTPTLQSMVFEEQRRQVQEACFRCGGAHYASACKAKAHNLFCTSPCPQCKTTCSRPADMSDQPGADMQQTNAVKNTDVKHTLCKISLLEISIEWKAFREFEFQGREK